MDLRARLKALETRLGVGQPATARPLPTVAGDTCDETCNDYFGDFAGSSTPLPTPLPYEPLASRLQRFAMAQRERPAKRSITDEDLARLLGGSLCGDGVVLVEHAVPASSRHGTVCYADIHSASLDFLAGGIEPARDNLVFIDTETTGLAGGTGTIAFLLGLARVNGDQVEVRQYFLTRFAGEATMLQHALGWVSARSHLVSFNGKSFDLPLLMTRYRLSRLAHPFTDLPHIDLLHRTRAAFGRQWPDCRLQTAERQLLKLFRDDDIPGHMIPQIWTDLLQRGETRDLRGVVEHNRIDILSLVALASVVGRTYAEPGHAEADPLGIARAHRKTGNTASAVRHLEASARTLPDDARLELAGLYARSGNYEKAVPMWTQLADNNVLDAMERLAIYHEHRCRDYGSALQWTERMLSLARNAGDVEKRRARLARKSARDVSQA